MYRLLSFFMLLYVYLGYVKHDIKRKFAAFATKKTDEDEDIVNQDV